MEKYLKRIASLFLVAILLHLACFFVASPVEASGFTKAVIRLDRMEINNANTNILIVAKIPAGTQSEASIGIKVPSGFVVNSSASAIGLSTTGLPTSVGGEAVNAWPGIGSAASAVSGSNITVTSTNVTAGSAYGFYITNGITNPSSTGQKTFTLSTHTSASPDFSGYTNAIDKSFTTTYIVSDNGTATDSDQITVTATVSPTYTLVITTNDVALQTSLSNVEYPGSTSNGSVTAPTITATTNGNNGHVMWMKAGSNSGLVSAGVGASIPFSGTAADATTTTLSAGIQGVVVDIDNTANPSGTLTVSSEFNGSTASSGGTPSTTFQEIAVGTGPTTGDVVTFMPRVTIGSSTKSATDYTATFTVIGAGNF